MVSPGCIVLTDEPPNWIPRSESTLEKSVKVQCIQWHQVYIGSKTALSALTSSDIARMSDRTKYRV